MWDWDEAKRQQNLRKHAVDFLAAERFDWTVALVAEDDRRDYGEPRLIAMGPIDGRLHVMVFTNRSGRLRLISLRRANEREVARWERTTRQT
jgi:hypothetical protein